MRGRGPAGAWRGAGVAVAVLALLRRPLRQPPQEDQAKLHHRGEVIQVCDLELVHFDLDLKICDFTLAR